MAFQLFYKRLCTFKAKAFPFSPRKFSLLLDVNLLEVSLSGPGAKNRIITAGWYLLVQTCLANCFQENCSGSWICLLLWDFRGPYRILASFEAIFVHLRECNGEQTSLIHVRDSTHWMLKKRPRHTKVEAFMIASELLAHLRCRCSRVCYGFVISCLHSQKQQEGIQLIELDEVGS
jgi:hypothetical protein